MAYGCGLLLLDRQALFRKRYQPEPSRASQIVRKRLLGGSDQRSTPPALFLFTSFMQRPWRLPRTLSAATRKAFSLPLRSWR